MQCAIITIPGSVNSIGDYAFLNCKNLTVVTIPNGVETIGNSVFSKCTNLSSVTIPANVNEIGYCAFSGCDSLISIEVAEGNQKYRSVDGVLIDSIGMLITYPAYKSEDPAPDP